ncbi:GAF domain-containing DNA-binding protein [Thalassospira profundimaris]|nr:LytTR family transcriptional regulator DNA-binding domain-containing protein [Thalassospira profundimaris]
MLLDEPFSGTPDVACPPFEIFDHLTGDTPPDSSKTGTNWLFQAAQMLLSKPCDDAISRILAYIGTAARADRAWMFEYDETGLLFRNTHEWSRENISCHVADLQDTPVTMIAWLHSQLAAGRAVMINDVAALPHAARDLQAEMLRQNDKSVLSVPIFSRGVLRACIGFDATSCHMRWGSETIIALAQCGVLIATARYERTTGLQPDGNENPKTPLPSEPLIHLRSHGLVRGVTSVEISGLHSSHDYTTVYLDDGSQITDLRPLSVWSGLLPAKHFLRIHRTSVINLLHVRHLDRHAGSSGQRWEVLLRGTDKPWTVSRPYRRDLRYRLGV